MILNNKKVILFDLDGTLIDSVPDLALSVNLLLEELKLEKFSEDIIRTWVGNGAKTLVERALSGSININKDLDTQLSSKALEIFLSIYAKNLAISTCTYKNVNSTLQALKQRGYTMAIVTNKPFDFVEPILNSLKLNGLFDLILGGDSLLEKKPSATPLIYACKKLNVSIDDSIMVGDSKNDILAANNCGMHSIGVTYGYNYGENISVYKPTKVVDNFSELLEIL